MLYILWGLLNVGLLIYFLMVYAKAIRLVKEKMGIIAALMLVAGLLSYLTLAKVDNDNIEPHSSRIKTWGFTPLDSLQPNTIVAVDTLLEKTWISRYELSVQLGKDKQGNNVAANASTFTTGLTLGTSWKPASIIINPTEDNHKFAYEVDGTIQWKLLGITLYSQSKNWKGFVIAKQPHRDSLTVGR